jgi:high affinity Mn2+ porin
MQTTTICLLIALAPMAAGAASLADDNGAAATPVASAAEVERDSSPPESWSLHGQFTNTTQYHPSFRSPYQGANSMDPGNSGRETIDLTLYAGLRLWKGAAVYVNPEIDQGFGLTGTLGAAGFTSAEAYKVGDTHAYWRMPRYFLRQVIGLGGEEDPTPSAPNLLAGPQPSDNVTLTVGKFSVVDIFDTNRYAHDPRADFLNWAVVESGAYDYAADSWGYSAGAAAEWTQSWWTLRGGFFALSRLPNQTQLDVTFQQFELVAEFEERHAWLGHPGKVKLLAFNNRGRMGEYDAAVDVGLQTGTGPNTVLVRHMASRPGVALNIEQELTADLGTFARASWNDGTQEAFEFTDINRSLSAGLSLAGKRWSRDQDTLGVAFVINGLSTAARRYFAAGGLGVLIGDGQLPDYGLEKIVETYYSAHLLEGLTVSADFQYVVNPAYNGDRGPISIFGLRIHAEL